MSSRPSLIDKRIAILGGSTTAQVKDLLEVFLLKEGFRPMFYKSEYNKYKVKDHNYNGKYFYHYLHANELGADILSKRLKQDLDRLNQLNSLARDPKALFQLPWSELTKYGMVAR